eukprot:7238581-Pyramimonas_sp.AAC.1
MASLGAALAEKPKKAHLSRASVPRTTNAQDGNPDGNPLSWCRDRPGTQADGLPPDPSTYTAEDPPAPEQRRMS